VTEITNLESSRDWLDRQPNIKIAQLFASRASLRAVPFLWRKGKMNRQIFSRLLTVALWQNVIVRSAITNQYELSYHDANDFAHNIHNVAVVSAREVDAVCGYAATSADYAATSSNVLDDTWNAVRTSAQVARKFSYFNEFLDQFNLDVSRFEREKSENWSISLPLWSITQKWWENELKRFAIELTRPEMAQFGYGVWLDWYFPIARGEIPFGLKDRKEAESLERRIALGGQDGKFHAEFWSRKPGEINREIARWLAEARAAEVLQEAEVAGPGLSWGHTSVQYKLVISGDANDADVAGEAETAFEHSKLNARLAKLSRLATTISARRGWEQLQDVCSELTNAIAVPTVELHTRILQIYDASLMLASLLDYNNKLVADRGGNEFRPLQADESLALQQVVMTVAPWIGRFPTAKRKDTEAGQMFSRMSEDAIFAHVKFVNQVQSAGLISEQDRRMLQSLLEALLKLGNTLSAPAEKAQAHGQGTVRKLTFAMALIVSNALSAVSGAVGAKLVEDVVSETQTYKATVKFLRDPLTELENIVKELPPHLRVAFETVLQQLKREVPEMPTPEPVAYVAKRRPIPRRK
jgi:hypothetical protein